VAIKKRKKYGESFIKEYPILSIFTYIFMIIGGLIIVIGLDFVINGSLEMFPTSDKQDEVHTVGVFFIIIGVMIILFVMLIKKFFIWLMSKNVDNK